MELRPDPGASVVGLYRHQQGHGTRGPARPARQTVNREAMVGDPAGGKDRVLPIRTAGPRIYPSAGAWSLMLVISRTSTRRFFARPAVLLFAATGLSSPRPMM